MERIEEEREENRIGRLRGNEKRVAKNKIENNSPTISYI